MIRTLGAVALLMAVYAAAAASPAFVLQCPLSSGWGSLTHPAAHPRVKEARARCAAAPQSRRCTRTAAELSAGGLPGAGSGHPGEDLCSLSVSFSWPDFVADALSRSRQPPHRFQSSKACRLWKSNTAQAAGGCFVQPGWHRLLEVCAFPSRPLSAALDDG